MPLFDPDYLRGLYEPATRAYAATDPGNRWRDRLASEDLDAIEAAIAEACTWEDLSRRVDSLEAVEAGGLLPDYICTRASKEFEVEPTLLLSGPVTAWTDLHPRADQPIDRHFKGWGQQLRDHVALAPRSPRKLANVTLFVTLHEDATFVLCRDCHLEQAFDTGLRHESPLRFHPERAAAVVAGFGNYPHPVRIHGTCNRDAAHPFDRRLLEDVPFVL